MRSSPIEAALEPESVEAALAEQAASPGVDGHTNPKLNLDSLKKTVVLTRPDLRRRFGGPGPYLDWWLYTEGKKEYRAFDEFENLIPHRLAAKADSDCLVNGDLKFTELMRIVWDVRDDAREKFDITDAAGQGAFVRWYFLHYIGEAGNIEFLSEEQRTRLAKAGAQASQDSFMPVTSLMEMAWEERPDLQEAFDIRTPDGANRFLLWFFTYGPHEFRVTKYIDEVQAGQLLAPIADNSPIPRIHAMIWGSDAALKARFASPGDPDFVEWTTSNEAFSAYPVLERLDELSRPKPRPAPSIRKARAERPFGVNLIGYAFGDLGIGEDVRMAARSMKAAGIPYTVHNVSPGREVSEGDRRLEGDLSDELPYSINMFCATGIETARLAAVHGSTLFDDRKCIGYWPWELPEWPADWHHAYELVDEVWASSRYTCEAFRKSSPKPVRHMPMAVAVDETEGLTRRDFDLPEKDFLFVFSFDVLSSMARKNPLACVEAFRRAFPAGNEPVGLVIKVMRPEHDNANWSSFLEAIKGDPRIRTITSTLRRGGILDLYRASDCFLSLHRAEGFGRGIAEAMLLGKPVIATAFSGNMDFTEKDASLLVPYRMRSVAGDDYPFADGLEWADPDVLSAVAEMKRLFEDRALYRALSGKAAEIAESRFDPGVVGRNYAQGLFRESIKKNDEIESVGVGFHELVSGKVRGGDGR